jgi:CheY-like chemotaxis protein
MATGFVLLALAIIAIIMITRLSLNGSNPGAFGWLGATIMTLAAVALFIIRADFQIPAEVAFIFGFAFLLIGIYRGRSTKNESDSPDTDEIQSKAVSDILHVAATRESLIELLNYSLDRFLEIMSLNSGTIHIHHAARNTLVMGAYRGLSPLYANKLEMIQPGQTAIGRALQNHRVLIIRDLRVSPDYDFFGGKIEGYSFLAVAPIMVENECWGVITILGRKRYERGMLDVTLLEQFGRQLGQALQVGRQNRSTAAAYARHGALIEIYNEILADLDWGISEKRITDSLRQNREKLFGGKSFWLLKISGGLFNIISGPQRRDYNYIRNGNGQQLNIPLLLLQARPYQLFDISPTDFGQILPGELRESQALCGYGFASKNNLIGLVIVDDKKEPVAKDSLAELAMLNNLLKLLHYSESISISDKNGRPTAINGFARELNDLFEGVSGHVQLLTNELQRRHDLSFSPNVGRWLKNLDEVAGRGARILDEIGRGIDPNTIIQATVKANNLNIEFVPDPLIGPLKSNKEEFKEVIREILVAAIQDNRRLTVKASGDNKQIALTLEGAVKPNYPSPELLQKARLHNIDLKIITSPEIPTAPNTPGEINPNGAINVVVAENRDIIQHVLADLLNNIGCHYSLRSSGGETIAFIEESRKRGETIDAVIADMGLEDIPGLHLCRQIKSIDATIRTIVISSWGTHLPGALLNESSVDAVLYKPFRLEQLKQILPLGNLNNAPEN